MPSPSGDLPGQDGQQQAGGSQGQESGSQSEDGSGEDGGNRQAGTQPGDGTQQDAGGAGAEGTEGEAGAAGPEGDWPGEAGAGGQAGTAGQAAGAEEAFDRSLEDFDDLMGQERETMAQTGVGTAADEALVEAGSIGGSAGETETATGEEPTGGSTAAGGSQNSAGSAEIEGVGEGNEARPQIQGCNDQDKVARQLCEAATEEQDPFLRAALWDEYNEYKRILARQ
jgi:hypothetical protein